MSIGDRLKEFLLRWDQPYKFAAHLTFLGIFGTIIGSYLQYNSWRDEKNLSRYENELSSAIATASEIVAALSTVMNQQQMLLFTFANAEGYEGPIEDQIRRYLLGNAKALQTRYFETHGELRQNIDALTGKAALYLDRPVETDARRAETLGEQVFLASNRDQLRNEGFDCKAHMPVKHTVLQLDEHKINWDSVRDNVETFFYCLDEIHNSLLFVRAWAESSSASSHDRGTTGKRVDSLKTDVTLQSRRLKALIAISNDKIETLRLKDRPQGFIQHQL